MRIGDIVVCIKDYWYFEKGEYYIVNSVWYGGGGCSIEVQISANKIAYVSFSKEKIEEHFTNLEIERRLKLRKINKI